MRRHFLILFTTMFLFLIIPIKALGIYSFFQETESYDAYSEAVKWANETGVVSDSKLNNEEPLSRAEAISLLWKAAGEREAIQNHNCSDVPTSSIYYNAINWAYENGITNGVNDYEFGFDANCTRGQFVTFLWRYADCPESRETRSMYDITEDEYCFEPVNWFVENHISSGVGENRFSPGDECTTVQAIVFLWRFALNSPVSEHNIPLSEIPVPKLNSQLEECLTAYAKFLEGQLSHGDNYYHARFQLVNLNGDSLPELAYIEGASHADGVYVYNYYDGEVRNISLNGASFGSWGQFEYSCPAKLIVSRYYGMGVSRISFFTMNSQGFASSVLNTEANYYYSLNEKTFTVDGTQSTHEEYTAAINNIAGNYIFQWLGYNSAFNVSRESILRMMEDYRVFYGSSDGVYLAKDYFVPDL